MNDTIHLDTDELDAIAEALEHGEKRCYRQYSSALNHSLAKMETSIKRGAKERAGLRNAKALTSRKGGSKGRLVKSNARSASTAEKLGTGFLWIGSGDMPYTAIKGLSAVRPKRSKKGRESGVFIKGEKHHPSAFMVQGKHDKKPMAYELNKRTGRIQMARVPVHKAFEAAAEQAEAEFASNFQKRYIHNLTKGGGFIK
ncbi:hypothetical protein EDC56_1262 [Sinobacterium caligoides]|uniref:Uncharacterized protein n=1 Tax=Sinobacterium caligoides TaxID=933926 RepID=A0A3N2E0R7_9GAMM|nr:hypothetical protein [Sinobacterium caligoides]ROS05713.1 hypothetical protein EDC56_1262 [Sinobacterium caligoides]